MKLRIVVEINVWYQQILALDILDNIKFLDMFIYRFK